MDAADRIVARVQKADVAGVREPELYAAARELYREIGRLLVWLRAPATDLKALRSGGAQAKACAALEALLNAKSLALTVPFRVLIVDVYVALFARGDAGGQVYAAVRSLQVRRRGRSSVFVPLSEPPASAIGRVRTLESARPRPDGGGRPSRPGRGMGCAEGPALAERTRRAHQERQTKKKSHGSVPACAKPHARRPGPT